MNTEINTECQEYVGYTLLAQECAKLAPQEERTLAEEGLATALADWPEY